MDKKLSEKMAEVNMLADEYRVRCLWFLREDYYPATTAEACRVLQYIERNGDTTAFRRAATLRQRLLQNSSEASAK